jgi:hypothetical protein
MVKHHRSGPQSSAAVLQSCVTVTAERECPIVNFNGEFPANPYALVTISSFLHCAKIRPMPRSSRTNSCCARA